MKHFATQDFVFRVYDESMTFFEAQTLCVDGWNLPTITQLQILTNEHYVPGRLRYFNGSHKKPKLYWLPGYAKNPWGKKHKGFGKEKYTYHQIICGLYNFDLECGSCNTNKNWKHNLILVKKI